jgi:L-erythro-3,5-diaminohexanoate dehydrogenase
LCDLIINVVNVPGTETPSILCTKNDGQIGIVFFFSMATKFDQAALATDSLGKDALLIIGNGVSENQVGEIFNLVLSNPILEKLIMDTYS